ncbi:peptidase M1 [Pontibacter akesuensis]|nr:peptidase M1 [Pontibacter akesuensis]
MNQYDMTFYKLDLQLERDSRYVAGNVTLQARARQPLNVFAFELHPNFQIDSVVVNGQRQASINRAGVEVAVPLAVPVAAAQLVRAVIYYKGTAPSGNNAAIGNGFSTAREPQWGNSVTWSLSEPYAAYEWWPTKQVLTDKADSVHVFVTTAAENKVGSNGLLTRVVDLPDGRKRHEWKSRYPIDYYLVSVAVSDYEEYVQVANLPDAPAPVPIVNYVYRGGALERYKQEIDRTAGFLEQFSAQFGLYPFYKEKYGHSMAPMGGGMEHQTMTTQSTFTFTLTAHELAHQWFGDNVTCASWQDIWLNEGFASYAEYLALKPYSETAAENWLKDAHTFALQRPQGSLKVEDTTRVSRIFDYRLTYKKGASVVHMLRFELNNDALFFQALREYQQRFGGGTARTSDLQLVMEEVSGKDLDYFFDQWYSGEGYPIYAVEWNQENGQAVIRSTQTTSATTPFFRSDVEYGIVTANDTIVYRLTQEQPVTEHLVQADAPILDILVDPNNWLLQVTEQVVQNTALEIPAPANAVLFPNPVYTSEVHVANLSFQPNTAFIYDAAGRTVRQLSMAPSYRAQLDVSSLSGGWYLLHLTDGQQHFRSSFIRIRTK